MVKGLAWLTATLAVATVLGCKADRTTAPAAPAAAASTAGDALATAAGQVQITPINHASILMQFSSIAIYVDPTRQGKYDSLPQGDLFLITHAHPDHADPTAVATLKKDTAAVVGPEAVAAQFPAGFTVMKNGDKQTVAGIAIEAIPAYNRVRGPGAGQLFHPRGEGNGYVLTLGRRRVYISGDTECTPEMKSLARIDIAFVCMNLPYTMSTAEAADCIKAFQPKVLYPYHYRAADLGDLQSRLSGEKAIEVRLRNWY
jgi:L-ascorbate metabolism protein UlaG (beta-lactamase superfamily)